MNGYAVFDIETTGLALRPDSIVEIAVVHVDRHGEITGSWETLLKPTGGVGPTSIHGVTEEMVRRAPTFREIAADLYALFAGRVAVAHNLPAFDGRFVCEHFDRCGIDAVAVKHGICTLKHARRCLPGPPHNLASCCQHLGIPLDGAHQALADTVATAKLLRHFITAGVALTGAVVPLHTGVPTPRSAPLDPIGRRPPGFLPRSAVLRRSL